MVRFSAAVSRGGGGGEGLALPDDTTKGLCSRLRETWHLYKMSYIC